MLLSCRLDFDVSRGTHHARVQLAAWLIIALLVFVFLLLVFVLLLLVLLVFLFLVLVFFLFLVLFLVFLVVVVGIANDIVGRFLLLILVGLIASQVA